MNVLDLVRKITEADPKQARQLEAEIDAAIGKRVWYPQEGPQMAAYFSKADQLFYGGAAGGGKTDLLLGLASTAHSRSLILRREGTDLGAIEERLLDMWQSRDGYNGQYKIMRRDGRFIELGSCPYEKDKFGYQGQPHDLKAFDEITQFSRSIFHYVIGWNRSTLPSQRCRVVCAGNPPSTPEGEWVKHYWGPWLDPGHRNPAKPGELRWFTTTDDDEDIEVEKDWRGRDAEGNELRPVSRTFISARLNDNAYLGADYRARIASMPEPYRTQLLTGSFTAGVKDHPRQVIPTLWVDAAVERWRRRKALLDAGQARKWVMTALGCDPALGGDDEFVLAPLYDNVTVGELIRVPGKEITTGPLGAALVIQHHRDKARLVIDMGGGYGDTVVSHLTDKLPIPPLLYKGGEGSTETARRSGLYFANKRSEAYWRLREALDPDNPDNVGAEIALPPDDSLKADLVAPTFEVRGDTIHIEPKEKLCARIGRSTDCGDAVVMALAAPPLTQEDLRELENNRLGRARKPRVVLGHAHAKRR